MIRQDLVSLRPNRRLPVRQLFLGAALCAGLAATSAHAATGEDAIAGMRQYVGANSGASGFKLLRGKVSGGNAPVAYSVVELYAAGNSGYGTAAAIGLGFTDGAGNITAVYSCSSRNPQIYAEAIGGDAGGGYNSAIDLSAALGSCNSLPANVTINEATTVASVYALNAFLDHTGKEPGAPSSNQVGLANSFALVANLADVGTGLAQTALPGGVTGTPPAATLNTLADALVPCVTSSGPGSAACKALFAAAGASGNTLQAALGIARNPGANAAAVYALAGASGPFQPALPAAPADWTLSIAYSGGQLVAPAAPTSLAVDAAGKVWVSARAGRNKGSVLALGPTGAQSGPFTDNGAVNTPEGVAVDAGGKVWIANTKSVATVNNGLGSLSALDGSGNSVAGSPFVAGGLATPKFVATDASGNVWASNTSSVTGLAANAAYAATNYPVVVAGSGLESNLTALALDQAGNVFVSDSSNNVLVGLSAADPTQQIAGSPLSGAGLHEAPAIAFDATGDVWTANSPLLGVSNGLTEFQKTATGFNGVNFLGGVALPGGGGALALDSSGNAWVADTSGLVKFGANGVPAVGSPFATAALGTPPSALALDASGNVWMADGASSTVVQVVGAAAPVKTPLIGQPRLP